MKTAIFFILFNFLILSCTSSVDNTFYAFQGLENRKYCYGNQTSRVCNFDSPTRLKLLSVSKSLFLLFIESNLKVKKKLVNQLKKHGLEYSSLVSHNSNLCEVTKAETLSNISQNRSCDPGYRNVNYVALSQALKNISINEIQVINEFFDLNISLNDKLAYLMAAGAYTEKPEEICRALEQVEYNPAQLSSLSSKNWRKVKDGYILIGNGVGKTIMFKVNQTGSRCRFIYFPKSVHRVINYQEEIFSKIENI